MKKSNDPCHYDTLGIDEYASESEIKKAFRKKVRPSLFPRSRNDIKQKTNRPTRTGQRMSSGQEFEQSRKSFKRIQNSQCRI